MKKMNLPRSQHDDKLSVTGDSVTGYSVKDHNQIYSG